MQQRALELWVGLFVAAGLAALLGLALQVSNIPLFQQAEGYRLEMRFDDVGGLKVRAPVTLAGVRIGRVSSIELDSNAFQALVTVTIEADYNGIPDDSDARILTSGLLGEQYIAINPGGGSGWTLEDGDSIYNTQGALVLERLIGRFLAGMGEQ